MEIEYKHYAKMLDKVIKVDKSRHESDLIRKNSNNPRNLWKYINTKLEKNVLQHRSSVGGDVGYDVGDIEYVAPV